MAATLDPARPAGRGMAVQLPARGPHYRLAHLAHHVDPALQLPRPAGAAAAEVTTTAVTPWTEKLLANIEAAGPLARGRRFDTNGGPGHKLPEPGGRQVHRAIPPGVMNFRAPPPPCPLAWLWVVAHACARSIHTMHRWPRVMFDCASHAHAANRHALRTLRFCQVRWFRSGLTRQILARSRPSCRCASRFSSHVRQAVPASGYSPPRNAPSHSDHSASQPFTASIPGHELPTHPHGNFTGYSACAGRSRRLRLLATISSSLC